MFTHNSVGADPEYDNFLFELLYVRPDYAKQNPETVRKFCLLLEGKHACGRRASFLKFPDRRLKFPIRAAKFSVPRGTEFRCNPLVGRLYVQRRLLRNRRSKGI